MSNIHTTELSIERLASAIRGSFDWVLEQDRQDRVDDFAGAWVDMLASALADVQLTAAPVIDQWQPYLPFIERHVIRTEIFKPLRTGMRGGPTIDVLFQLWFDTEEMACAYGIPLLFRKIPNSGRISGMMWHDLQDACRKITVATPSARVLFVAAKHDFNWFGRSSFFHPNPIIATDTHSIVGAQLPPAPVAGRMLDAFCLDLASGWICDPALSGKGSSPVLDEVLSNFMISHVLRIQISRQSTTPIYKQTHLPL